MSRTTIQECIDLLNIEGKGTKKTVREMLIKYEDDFESLKEKVRYYFSQPDIMDKEEILKRIHSNVVREMLDICEGKKEESYILTKDLKPGDKVIVEYGIKEFYSNYC